MEKETDEAIATRVQKGDSEAFGQLVERYEEKLMRYARKFLRDPDDAKDIVQEVFIKSYQNIQSFDATRRFSPWIYRIAHNEFVNAIKKRSRGPVFGTRPRRRIPASRRGRNAPTTLRLSATPKKYSNNAWTNSTRNIASPWFCTTSRG